MKLELHTYLTLLARTPKTCTKLLHFRMMIERILSKFWKPSSHDASQRRMLFMNVTCSTDEHRSLETIDHYITDVIKLAENCQYGGLRDDLIRDRLVSGIRDDKVREKLLGTKDLRLSKTIEILKTSQALKYRVKDMASVTSDEPVINVNKVKRGNRQAVRDKDSESRKRGPNRDQKQLKSGHKRDRETTNSTNSKPCKFCGKKHEFKRDLCPATDKECHKCKKKGHFAAVCHSAKKPVYTLGEDESFSEEESYAVCEEKTHAISTVKSPNQIKC